MNKLRVLNQSGMCRVAPTLLRSGQLVVLDDVVKQSRLGGHLAKYAPLFIGLPRRNISASDVRFKAPGGKDLSAEEAKKLKVRI